MKTKTRRLDRQDFGYNIRLDPNSIRFNVEEEAFGYARAQMIHMVYGEHVGEYVYATTHPATWWDHFKQDVFPEFLLKRYPAQYTTDSVRLDIKAMYPDYQPIHGYNQPYYHIREVEVGPLWGIPEDSETS